MGLPERVSLGPRLGVFRVQKIRGQGIKIKPGPLSFKVCVCARVCVCMHAHAYTHACVRRINLVSQKIVNIGFVSGLLEL